MYISKQPFSTAVNLQHLRNSYLVLKYRDWCLCLLNQNTIEVMILTKISFVGAIRCFRTIGFLLATTFKIE